MIVLYHNTDLDGLACAVLLEKLYSQATFIGWNFDKPLPDFSSPVYSDKELIIADLNLSKEQIIKLAKCFKFVHYMDHHQQKEVDCPNLYWMVDTSKAACEIVWEWLYKNENYPYWIKQIARYDIHRDEDGKGWLECEQYQFGLRHCTTKEQLSEAIKRGRRTIVEEGRIVLRYKTAMATKSEVRKCFWKVDAIIYSCSVSSHYLTTIPSLGQDLHLVITFNTNNLKIRVSVFSLNDYIDASIIANQFGGGGHQKIAGFFTNKLDLYV